MKSYETRDLYLAVSLKLHGFKLIEIKSIERGKGRFAFEDTEPLRKCVKDYFSGDLQGSLKNFVTVWKDLRGYLFEVIDEN